MDQRYLAAIQIGSSCVKGALAKIDADISTPKVNVIAIESVPINNCVRYGVIQNVKEVEAAVADVIRLLNDHLKNRRIAHVYVAIDGRSFRAKSKIIEHQYFDETEITERLIEEIKNEARIDENSDNEVIDVLAKSFIIDKAEVANPIGSFGSHIKANLTQLVCSSHLTRNIERVIPVTITKKVALHTAIADMVLTSEEKQIGCMLVDLGAQTTTVSIYRKGVLQYLATIPMGSRNITNDIASVFNLVEEKAEALKLHPEKAPEGIDSKRLENCINARSEEIVVNIVAQLRFAGNMSKNDIPAGIVLVGQGAKLDATTDYFRKHQLKFHFGEVDNTIDVYDSNIDPAECIDIISILKAASKFKVDSTELVEDKPYQGEIEFEDENEDQIEEPDDYVVTGNEGGKNGVKKGKGWTPGWLGGLIDKINRIAVEEEDDDDDDENKI